jgi:hypothetical protein
MSQDQNATIAVKYALAHAAFEQASVLYGMLTALPLSTAEKVGITAGLVACYSRPFGPNWGLGRLEDLTRFDDVPMAEDFARTHHERIVARDKLFAHRDVTTPATGLEAADIIHIVLRVNDGTVRGAVNSEPLLSRFTEGWVGSLLPFQMVRCGAALQQAVLRLMPNPLDGDYDLTLDGMKRLR